MVYVCANGLVGNGANKAFNIWLLGRMYSFSYYRAFSTAVAHVFPNVFMQTAILCGLYTNFKNIHTVLGVQVLGICYIPANSAGVIG